MHDYATHGLKWAPHPQTADVNACMLSHHDQAFIMWDLEWVGVNTVLQYFAKLYVCKNCGVIYIYKSSLSRLNISFIEVEYVYLRWTLSIKKTWNIKLWQITRQIDKDIHSKTQALNNRYYNSDKVFINSYRDNPISKVINS